MKRVATLLLLAACTSAPTGFLGYYDVLTPRPGVEGQRAWTKPGVDLRDYDRLMIDPIEMQLEKGQTGVGSEKLRRASEQFRSTFLKTIGPYYPVVTERKQHTMRIRVAVTHIVPSGGELRMNGASMEVEFLDADSNERLAVLVDKPTGSGSTKKAFRAWCERLLSFTDSRDG